MGRLSPEENWLKQIAERLVEFRISGELMRLRKKGLKVLGRKRLLTTEEWWKTCGDRMSSQTYMAWYNECKRAGDCFGLASWTIEMACLLKGYSFERQILVREVDWPRISIITRTDDPAFLAKLMYEAQIRGVRVLQQKGSTESLHYMSLAGIKPPPKPTSKPALSSTLSVRVDFPIGYPPEAASKLARDVSQMAKEIARRLGYSVPRRWRSSPLVGKAVKLRVGAPLASGEAYDVIDDIYGEDLTKDRWKRKIVASQRHKLQKRLVKPHEADTGETQTG